MAIEEENFSVSSEDCMILLACAKSSSLREAARLLNRDPAGLQRRVAELARRDGLFEKRINRWAPTKKGQRLISWTYQSARSQRLVLTQDSAFRIATLPWIGDFIVRSQSRWFENTAPEKSQRFCLLTDRQDLEFDLLDGKVDCAIACHPPKNPSLRHRRLGPEDWVICVPMSWVAEFNSTSRAKIVSQLSIRPLILHTQISPQELFSEIDSTCIHLQVDTLALVRAAIESGAGWGVLPKIYVQAADAHRIKVLPLAAQRGFISLWWRREATPAEFPVQKILKEVSSIFKFS